MPTFPLQTLRLSILHLLRRIHVLLIRLILREALKLRNLDRQTARAFTVQAGPERIVQSRFPGKVTFEIPPHQPEERPRATLATQRGPHDEIEEVTRREEMRLGDLRSVVCHDKNEVNRVGARVRRGLDLLERVGLVDVFGCAFQDGLEARSILELFVGIGILICLQ